MGAAGSVGGGRGGSGQQRAGFKAGAAMGGAATPRARDEVGEDSVLIVREDSSMLSCVALGGTILLFFGAQRHLKQCESSVSLPEGRPGILYSPSFIHLVADLSRFRPLLRVEPREELSKQYSARFSVFAVLEFAWNF